MPGLLARLKSAGLQPRKALGQHFLHDPKLLGQMVAAAGIEAGEAVFEVGTGPGTLTREIARVAGRVLTVEVDPALAAFARRELAGFQNVEILEADVLESKSRLSPSVEERLRRLAPFRWVSNLPYAIATPLVVTFLEAGLPWRRGVLTLQAEVAERLAAEPNAPAYGAATVLVAFWATAKVVRRLPAGAFWPPPKVSSAVIVLEPRAPPLAASGYIAYRRWVQCLFRARRKQLKGLLRAQLGPERGAEALRLGGWDPELRPEALSPDDFLVLARNFDLF
jgi:16S rRNA (adenine1518-N6/adenine1519-N6)-dimethyltransferase